ncbi:MAG: hypothetical protein QXL96_00435 [Ignisphaera sp.]
MFVCLDGEYSYMGALFKVQMRTVSEEICNNIMKAYEKGYEHLIKTFKGYGKCIILLEQPIKLITVDNSIELILKPKNFVAQMLWGEVVKRIKALCP